MDGLRKIAGEMRKLGYSRFGRTSVKRILKQHGLTPERQHSFGLGWLQFLSHYGQFIWASDFATVTTATLRTYYLVSSWRSAPGVSSTGTSPPPLTKPGWRNSSGIWPCSAMTCPST